MRFFFLIGVVVLHVSRSNAMAVDGKNVGPLQAVTNSANTFAPNFLKKVVELNKGNLICSPISASTILSLAAFGARGETEKQMRQSLALPADNQVAKDGFSTLIDSLNNYKQVELRMANKMFVRQDLQPKPEFQIMATEGFRSQAQNVDFSKATETSKIINDWCEAQTNNRIKDLIKSGDLSSDTALVLVNAVYFKGNWEAKFDPANTKPRLFHVNSNSSKEVPTMYRHGSYRYGELPDVKAKFVELPYADDMSMIVIVPDEIDGLEHVVQNFEKITMEQLLNGFKQDVNLYLPKFKIESDLQLNVPLKNMGMVDMFTDVADFSGLVSAPVSVSKVVQKAFIEVNEEGSEAAAATGMLFVMRCMPHRRDMKIDRPFVYMILTRLRTDDDTIEGGVLFSGLVADPTS